MRVRRLTNWYGPRGMICVGDVHEIDDEAGRQQLACGDVELAPKAAITPPETPDMHVETDSALAVTTAETKRAPAATSDAESEDAPVEDIAPIATMPAAAAIAAIGKIERLEDLVELHDHESKGKKRATVLAAIEAREAELSSATSDVQSEDATS